MNAHWRQWLEFLAILDDHQPEVCSQAGRITPDPIKLDREEKEMIDERFVSESGNEHGYLSEQLEAGFQKG